VRFVDTLQSLPEDGRKFLRMQGGVPGDISRLRLSLCTAWRKSRGGLTWHAGASGEQQEGLSAAQFAAILTECGVPCERQHVEAGLKREFKPNNCPATEPCLEALAKLRMQIPTLDPATFIATPAQPIPLAVGNAARCRFVAMSCEPLSTPRAEAA